MKNVIAIVFLFSCLITNGQGNCLIYPENSGERKACELSYRALEFSQGSKESQMVFDSAIVCGPNYAWSYYEKSVPYFKRGFLYEGLQLLNTAVQLEPLNYLCYRANWYWGYKNFDLCIEDLERYYSLPRAYSQFTPGGEKNMKVILSLAYAKNGNYTKAIKTLEDYIDTYQSESDIGFTDYHILGLMYVRNKQYKKAIEVFKNQFVLIDDIPDSYYYLGMAHEGLSNFKEAKKYFDKSLSLFEDKTRYRTSNGYAINISDVKKKLQLLKGILM